MNESSEVSDSSRKLRKSYRLHLTAIAAVALCLVLSRVEYLRAIDGHDRSAGYAIQWPIFALLAVWMWRKLYRQGKDVQNSKQTSAADEDSDQIVESVDDAELNAWRSYLKRLEPPKFPDN
jgi:hypothetical protein